MSAEEEEEFLKPWGEQAKAGGVLVLVAGPGRVGAAFGPSG